MSEPVLVPTSPSCWRPDARAPGRAPFLSEVELVDSSTASRHSRSRRPLVVVDRDRRRYELLYEDEHVDIWVLSWMPGQRTGFHDHDQSRFGLVCAQGTLAEASLAIGGSPETIEMTSGVTRSGPGRLHPRRRPRRR